MNMDWELRYRLYWRRSEDKRRWKGREGNDVTGVGL